MKLTPEIEVKVNTLADELAAGEKRGKLLGIYGEKWGVSRTTFDRLLTQAKKIATDREKLKKKATESTIVEETKKAVKRGLKTKSERVMEYQAEIARMEDQLYGRVQFTFKVGYSIKKSHSPTGEFMVPIDVQNELRAAIKSYKTEISRIEGDYEKDNRQKNDPVLLSDDQFDKLLNLARANGIKANISQ